VTLPTRRAALFDLDRTLVRKETASLYVRYQRERGLAGWRDLARVLYWVGQYTLGVIDVPKVAAQALAPFKGTRETVLSARCDDWFASHVEPHIADLGRAAVAEHQARGDVVAIVTGALVYTARPLARRLGIEHIVASELEVDDAGCFTGRPVHPLAYGDGKVQRTERLAARLGFQLGQAAFYSDSLTDLPLFERVGEPIAVNPDPRLRRVARERHWRVVRW
jgi:HAD superfamily hydrolase (TIGR01490 family)